MASLQIRKDRKKPYRVLWRDALSGKARNKSFLRRKEAQVFMESVRASENLCAGSDPNRTVADALDRWYQLSTTTGRGGREPVEASTARKYAYHDKIIRDRIGSMKLADLNQKECEAFRDALLADYSRKNAKKILTSFKSALSQAVSDHLMPFNPAEQVYIRISKRQRLAERVTIPDLREVGALTDAIQRLMEADNEQIRRAWSRYGPMFSTLLFSGLRPTEMRGLPWRDVDWDRGGIEVTQDADERNEIGLLKSGAGYRFVPLPRAVMAMLATWQESCPRGDLDLVFPNWQGKVENHGNLTRRGWYPLCREAGWTTEDGKAAYNLYTLRHIKAALEIERGASPKKVQTVMGHESIVMTLDIYGHLFKDKVAEDDADEIFNLVASVAQALPKTNQTAENVDRIGA